MNVNDGSKKSRRMTPVLSQMMFHITPPADVCVLNLFFAGEHEWCQSIHRRRWVLVGPIFSPQRNSMMHLGFWNTSVTGVAFLSPPTINICNREMTVADHECIISVIIRMRYTIALDPFGWNENINGINFGTTLR